MRSILFGLLIGGLCGCAGGGTEPPGAEPTADASAPDAGRAGDPDSGSDTTADGAPLDAAPVGGPDDGTDAAAVTDAAPPRLDVGGPPPPDAAPPSPLPPPAAVPPAPPPDESALVAQVAAEHPDLFESACLAQGGRPDFQLEVLRRLRARDVRWGFVRRDGAVLEDRVGYFYADGQPEGRSETYIVDYIVRYCARPGVDEPAAPGWLDDTAGGGTWTLVVEGAPPLPDAGVPPADAVAPPQMRPLPDESDTVDALANERPDLLAASCVDQGGNNEFLLELVRRLRARDPRWGFNWKRGNRGDLSQDAVDYFWAEGDPEDRTEVYIVDVIGAHCGDPRPAFNDVTEATRLGGTIGRWTLQPLR